MEKSQFEWNDTIGETGIRTYTLDNAWEVEPGDWMMEFYCQGRKIGEKALHNHFSQGLTHFHICASYEGSNFLAPDR